MGSAEGEKIEPESVSHACLILPLPLASRLGQTPWEKPERQRELFVVHVLGPAAMGTNTVSCVQDSKWIGGRLAATPFEIAVLEKTAAHAQKDPQLQRSFYHRTGKHSELPSPRNKTNIINIIYDSYINIFCNDEINMIVQQ